MVRRVRKVSESDSDLGQSSIRHARGIERSPARLDHDDAAAHSDLDADREDADDRDGDGIELGERRQSRPAWFRSIIAPYIGTRLGRQELMAEILSDTPGALWTRATLDRARLNLGGPADGVRVTGSVAPDPHISTVGVWGG